MFEFDSSLQRNWRKQETFAPPYCPNNLCSWHHFPPIQKWWHNHGWKDLHNFPYASKRFKCSQCQKTFSHSFFTLEYREHRRKLNETIFTLWNGGHSGCEIARIIGTSEHLVRTRLSKMARWMLLRHADFTEDLVINEPIVYDGLENFAFSQYDPNNVNHAIGKDSYFTYDFNFAPINRKGRMSGGQKLKKKQLEREHGRYPGNILRTTTKRIIERLLDKTNGGILTLHSDEHFQYRRAIYEDLDYERIDHKTISSKAARNFQNTLFAVNNFDMQIRQKSAAFSRETIAFSKNSVAMMEKFVLFTFHKNYMRPTFYKPHKGDETLHKDSPAKRLGIIKENLSFKDVFSTRVTASQVPLNEDWRNLFKKVDPLSRRKIVCNYGI